MNRSPDILIVGAGPTGLALALQVHAHGGRVRIVERRIEAFRPSRALIVHPRTLEALRPLGVTQTLLARADIAPEVELHLGRQVVRARLDNLALSDTPFPHLTLMRQMDIEAVLSQALEDRGVIVERGTELTDVEVTEDVARVTLRSAAGTERAEFDFIVGCDGPESTVRRGAGIGWSGSSYREEVVLADAELDTDLAPGVAHGVIGRHGLLLLFPLGERATWRLLATRSAGNHRLPFGQAGPPVPLDELQALLDEAGLDARTTDVAWSARYALQHRLATRFRKGRLFLAGDSAHAWSPAMGLGMNTGIQDALNLGWKLAFEPYATDRQALLDSYETERRRVARRMLTLTHLAFWVEAATGRLPSLLRALAPFGAPAFRAILGRRRIVAEAVRVMSQLRVSYRESPLSVDGIPRLNDAPRAGQRLPDATVICGGKRVRLHSLLARPGVHVLLQRDADQIEQRVLGPRVSVHRLASAQGSGLVAVRPDGYIGFTCGIADRTQLSAWLSCIGAARGSSGPPAVRRERCPTRTGCDACNRTGNVWPHQTFGTLLVRSRTTRDVFDAWDYRHWG